MVSEQDSSRTIKASASILYYKTVKEWLGVNDQNQFSNSCDAKRIHAEGTRRKSTINDV